MSNEPKELPPLDIGDPLPNLILPDSLNNGVGLSQQTHAGRWQVLVFASPGEVTSHADDIAEARKRLEAVEGELFNIGLTMPDPSMVGIDLFDESKRAAKYLLNSEGSGIAVLSPEPRLAARFSLDQANDAAAFCEQAFAADAPNTVTAGAPVLIIADVFEPELCARMMEFWKSAPKTQDEVASKAMGNEATYAEIKRRTDASIPDGELFSEIRHRIGQRVLPLIERAFRLRVASMEAPRIGCYSSENEGAFGRHRDNTTPFTAHRRLAMTANLNTGQYEGGELRFPEYGRTLYQPAAGAVVIFSCSLLHEALPVTKGERFGMFTFFTDAAGLEQEKAMRQRMQAQQAL